MHRDSGVGGRTRVKICGITRRQDAVAAARLGADAIGLVFYAPSPRAVSIDQAREIAGAVPPFVSLVGLFVNAAAVEVDAVLDRIPISSLQFHGDEAPQDCRRYNLPYIKAVAMSDDVDLARQRAHYTDAAGLLVDTYDPERRGGSGRTFDWSRIPVGLDLPIVLAGGLNADNVAQAIKTARPYAVDVSGGVEYSPGVKDRAKMTAFFRGVNSAHNG